MGKGSSAPSTSTVEQSNLPAYAEPYFTELLERTSEQSTTPYTPYEGPRIAEYAPETTASYDLTRQIAGQGIAGLPEAMGATYGALQGTQGLAYANQPYQFSMANVDYGGGMGGQGPGLGAALGATRPDMGGVRPPKGAFSGTRGGGMTLVPGSQPVRSDQLPSVGDTRPDMGGVRGPKGSFSGSRGGGGIDVQSEPKPDFSGFSGTRGGGGISGVAPPRMANPQTMGPAQPAGGPPVNNQVQVSPYSGFSATGGQRSGFQEAQVSPYSGFSATGGQRSGFQEAQVSPYSQFDPYSQFSATGVNQYGYSPTQAFTGQNVGQYMSPYMQNVLDVQKDQARRQFEEQRGTRDARAVAAGAFGGSRQAVQEGMAERDLLNRMADIQATGQQNAFQSAQQAFQSDRAADFARQQAQAAELGRTQGIGVGEAARVQQAQAAEQARVQQAQAAELARTQGIGVSEAGRVQGASAAEQARLDALRQQEMARVQAAQAAEQARIQGIGVGELGRVQGAQAAENRAAGQFGLGAFGQAANLGGQLAALGETGRATDIQNAQLLETIGSQQQGLRQQQLDLAYQDFLRQQAYPEQQLQLYSSILRGVPVDPTTSTTLYQPYNPLQQALGAGLGAIGLYRGMSA